MTSFNIINKYRYYCVKTVKKKIITILYIVFAKLSMAIINY